MAAGDGVIPPAEFNLVSQFSHFFFGAFCALASAMFGTVPWAITFGIFFFYTGIKEFWWDEKYETPVVRGSSLLDFVVQIGGFLVGTVIFLIALFVWSHQSYQTQEPVARKTCNIRSSESFARSVTRGFTRPSTGSTNAWLWRS